MMILMILAWVIVTISILVGSPRSKANHLESATKVGLTVVASIAALSSIPIVSVLSLLCWVGLILFWPGTQPGTRRMIGVWLGIPALIFGLGMWVGVQTDSWIYLPLVLAGGAVFPFHSWGLALFERMRPTAAALILNSGIGSLAWLKVLDSSEMSQTRLLVAGLAVFTSVYASLLACVQKDARRLLGCLCVSLSAQVTCAWMNAGSVGFVAGVTLWTGLILCVPAMALCLEAVEVRTGNLSLIRRQGLGIRAPILSHLFLIFGLVIAGLPGLLGFVGEDLLFASSYSHLGFWGLLFIVAGAFNAIAILRARDLLFLGASPSVRVHDLVTRERLVLGVLLLSLLGCGVFPKYFIGYVVSHSDIATLNSSKEHP